MTVRKEAWEHLQKHVVYPATRNQIIEACSRMMEVPQEDKEYFEKYLPDWSYRNADEVIRGIEVSEHLGHVEYPTTKKELIKACNKMSDVPKLYREWFERNLPERNYSSVSEVLGTLKGITHIREHVNYPASKNVIIETCHKMEEVPEVDRTWFERYLPDKTYDKPDDVIKAFKM